MVVCMSTPAHAEGVECPEGCHAQYNTQTNTIWLNAESCSRPDMLFANLIHEVVHAWLSSSGAIYYLRTMMPDLTEEAFGTKIEETLVRMVSPAIESSIRDLATFLPKVPRGSK